MDVVVMPQLGETVVEGTITAWAKQVGDPVAIDDTLFEVSTEKVDTEVPSAVSGYLRALLVDEGATVPIGTPVAVITAGADDPFDPPAPGPAPAAPREPEPRTAGPAANGSGPAGTPAIAAVPLAGGSVRTPAVRRLLAEHGLDAAEVVGSGRDGRITRNDVLAAAAQRTRPSAPAPMPAPGPASPATPAAPEPVVGPDDEVVPLSRARLATAEHLHRSVQTAAHALVVVEVDWGAVDAVRSGTGLSYLPFAARAVVDALRRFPHLNATFAGDRLVVHRRIHLGIAVDVADEALLVPVVRDAHELRLHALGEAVAEVADLARRHRLPGGALDGATFTLTNVGAYGTVLAAPIIDQPQVAILSTDGIAMRPVAVPDERGGGWGVAVRPVGNLSLSFDHRAVDGAYAAAFLADVRSTLQGRDWAAEVVR
ncbi:dihydrolipoamide acetyltransferase family protein [Aquihabitans sp. McL0605]|uniref:dihydrolipoamide acetyltransferase family protein n=1 Tax=Aquihabitans sp. McL0605 TaxID=3415671 RepID=UPI003CEF76DF